MVTKGGLPPRLSAAVTGKSKCCSPTEGCERLTLADLARRCASFRCYILVPNFAVKKWRSPRGPRHSCSSIVALRTKAVHSNRIEASIRWTSAARVAQPARIPLRHYGRCEVWTNEEPRPKPTRQETRPNQRLYVPLGSPPSVAVGLP
jgi:hypothetical protein